MPSRQSYFKPDCDSKEYKNKMNVKHYILCVCVCLVLPQKYTISTKLLFQDLYFANPKRLLPVKLKINIFC